MASSGDSRKQAIVWDFRANEDYFKAKELRTFMDQLGKKWVFQLEEGGETGYRHWQGRVALWKIKRKSELMSLMKKLDMKVPNYLQPTSTTTAEKGSFDYAMKADTRVEGPWKNTDQAAYIPRQYRNKELWPYQNDIVSSKDVFNERLVDCIVDIAGCNGKSTVACIADLMHGCVDMPWINDADKLIASLCDILIAKQERDPGIIFMDMPRSCNKEKLYQLYAAIEQIKKGKVWDMRNSYKEWWFDSPRIWVFTNKMPDTNLLSADRWRFWSINEAKELVPYDPDADAFEAEI